MLFGGRAQAPRRRARPTERAGGGSACPPRPRCPRRSTTSAAGGLARLGPARRPRRRPPAACCRARCAASRPRLRLAIPLAWLGAEHALGDPARQPGLAAAPYRSRAARGGRDPAVLAVGHLQDQHGVHGEDPRGAGRRRCRQPVEGLGRVDVQGHAGQRGQHARRSAPRAAGPGSSAARPSPWPAVPRARSARSGRRRPPGSGHGRGRRPQRRWRTPGSPGSRPSAGRP